MYDKNVIYTYREWDVQNYTTKGDSSAQPKHNHGG